MRALVLVVILGLAIGLADAAPQAPQDPREVARALVAEGHAAWDRGEWATALERYQSAFSHFPAPNLHYDLGLAYDKLGHEVEALESFQHFLSDAPGAPADARAHAQARVVELEKVVPLLEVLTDPTGATIHIDGKLVGKTPLAALRVAAGVHEVTAEKRGLTPITRHVTLDPGVRQALPIAMAPLDIVLRPPSPSPSPSAGPSAGALPVAPARKRSILKSGWFWGGVGAVALTAVVVVVATSSSGPDYPDSELGLVYPFGK
jgi:PEGA domain